MFSGIVKIRLGVRENTTCPSIDEWGKESCVCLYIGILLLGNKKNEQMRKKNKYVLMRILTWVNLEMLTLSARRQQ